MSTTLSLFGAHTRAFRYDQLNRLKEAKNANGGDKWRENFAYDADGNMTKLQRYDDFGMIIDDVKQHYQSGTNRMTHIEDFAGVARPDIKDLPNQVFGNLYFKKHKKNFILTSDDEDLTADIEALNLNHSDLSKTRKDIFTSVETDINECLENSKAEEYQKKALQLLYEKYSQKDAETGKFIPYSSFRIWVLKSKFPKMFPPN
jgi:membrane-associated HD superfamily phosphohydrolase